MEHKKLPILVLMGNCSTEAIEKAYQQLGFRDFKLIIPEDKNKGC